MFSTHRHIAQAPDDHAKRLHDDQAVLAHLLWRTCMMASSQCDNCLTMSTMHVRYALCLKYATWSASLPTIWPSIRCPHLTGGVAIGINEGEQALHLR
jgi:hypothetical protein